MDTDIESPVGFQSDDDSDFDDEELSIIGLVRSVLPEGADCLPLSVQSRPFKYLDLSLFD